jgi:hypothetical protein
VKTPSRFFLEHRMETPDGKTPTTDTTTETPDTAKWGPNTNIPAFLVQHPDGAHTDESPIHTQHPGNNFASTTHFIYIDHHPS